MVLFLNQLEGRDILQLGSEKLKVKNLRVALQQLFIGEIYGRDD